MPSARCYGQLSGTMQAHVEGSPLLALQVGFNARNALVACDLAGQGWPAPQQVLEGEFGYFALFEGAHDLAPVVGGARRALAGMRGRAQAVPERPRDPWRPRRRARAAAPEHGFAADDVQGVVCPVPPLTARLVGRPARPGIGANQARLSAPYVLACALLDGGVDVDDFAAGGARGSRAPRARRADRGARPTTTPTPTR